MYICIHIYTNTYVYAYICIVVLQIHTSLFTSLPYLVLQNEASLPYIQTEFAYTYVSIHIVATPPKRVCIYLRLY